jgi:deoxyribonuclease-4
VSNHLHDAQITCRFYDVEVQLPGDPTENRRLIGPHLPLATGLLKAAARAEEIGATAVQIWTDNPTSWRRRQEHPRALAAFRDRLQAAGVRSISVHAPYLINLCGSDEDFFRKSIDTASNELRVAQLYGADFVVMHIGSHRGLGREAGITRLVQGLRTVLDQTSANLEPDADTPRLPRLVLENAAGSGDGIGAPLEDLADILDGAAADGLPLERLGICLDTAHLWGAGYDISGDRGVDGLVSRLDELVGRENVVMLHLNDSRTTLGSHLDRHEHIAAGEVGADGMRELLTHPWLATLPTFLETPGMDVGYDKVNLDRAQQLIEGETPPPLPREAFEVRSSKSRTAPPSA